MQLVPSKMNLKVILAVCALSFSSCENRERYSESYNKILFNDINTAKGYAKAFNLKPTEVKSYYLDFFRLYLLDKEKFKALMQKGQSFSQPYFLTLLSCLGNSSMQSMQRHAKSMQRGQSFSQPYFLTLLSRLGNSST
jgi:hypothetical protein